MRARERERGREDHFLEVDSVEREVDLSRLGVRMVVETEVMPTSSANFSYSLLAKSLRSNANKFYKTSQIAH